MNKHNSNLGILDLRLEHVYLYSRADTGADQNCVSQKLIDHIKRGNIEAEQLHKGIELELAASTRTNKSIAKSTAKTI